MLQKAINQTRPVHIFKDETSVGLDILRVGDICVVESYNGEMAIFTVASIASVTQSLTIDQYLANPSDYRIISTDDVTDEMKDKLKAIDISTPGRLQLLKDVIYAGTGVQGVNLRLNNKQGNNGVLSGTGSKGSQWFFGNFPRSSTHGDDISITNPDGGFLFDVTGPVRVRSGGRYSEVLHGKIYDDMPAFISDFSNISQGSYIVIKDTGNIYIATQNTATTIADFIQMADSQLRTWASAVDYLSQELIFDSNNILYAATADFTSQGNIDADIASGKLERIGAKNKIHEWITGTLYEKDHLLIDPTTNRLYTVTIDYTAGVDIPTDVNRGKIVATGALSFAELSDTPSTLSGNIGKVLSVNQAEDALEFTNPTMDAEFKTGQQVSQVDILKGSAVNDETVDFVSIIPTGNVFVVNLANPLTLPSVAHIEVAKSGSSIAQVLTGSVDFASANTDTYGGGKFGNGVNDFYFKAQIDTAGTIITIELMKPEYLPMMNNLKITINEGGLSHNIIDKTYLEEVLEKIAPNHFVAEFTPTSVLEYPANPGNHEYWLVSGLDADYTFAAGDAVGQVVKNGYKLEYSAGVFTVEAGGGWSYAAESALDMNTNIISNVDAPRAGIAGDMDAINKKYLNDALAAGTHFDGNLGHTTGAGLVPYSGLPDVAVANKGHYFVIAENETISGAIGTSAGLNGEVVEAGWWIQSTGVAGSGVNNTGYQIIKSDLLSKPRADELYDIKEWTAKDYDAGVTVFSGGFIYEAMVATVAADVPDPVTGQGKWKLIDLTGYNQKIGGTIYKAISGDASDAGQPQPKTIGDMLLYSNQAGHVFVLAASMDGTTWNQQSPSRVAQSMTGGGLPAKADYPTQQAVYFDGTHSFLIKIADRNLDWIDLVASKDYSSQVAANHTSPTGTADFVGQMHIAFDTSASKFYLSHVADMNKAWQPISMGHKKTQINGMKRVANQVICTRAQYNAVTHKDTETLYFIKP